MELQEFLKPISISSFIKRKHYSVFWGLGVSGIEGEHASVLSPDVLVDSLSRSSDEYLKLKDANVGRFIAVLNLQSADAFFRGVKASFGPKMFTGKDKIMRDRIKLFIYFQKLGNP